MVEIKLCSMNSRGHMYASRAPIRDQIVAVSDASSSRGDVTKS